MTAYTERDIIELACRAPACPEWFEPDMTGVQEPTPEQVVMTQIYGLAGSVEAIKERRTARQIVSIWESERTKRRLAQWPKAYARMVLESH